jgi:hypothetical protein
VINYSEFHDGFFDGFLIEEKSVSIFLSTYKREQFVIELSEVSVFTASDIKAGNIIFEVLTRSGAQLTLEDMVALDGPFQTTSQDHAERRLAQASKDESTLLEINPSYGATCLALAHSVKLYPRSEWITRVSANYARSRITP